MRVFLLYLTTVLIWGSTWIAIRYQLGNVAEEYSIAYRFLLAALGLLIFAKLTNRRLTLERQHYPMVVITGILMFSFNYLLTYYSVNYITTGLVAVAFSFMVVTNALFERLLFGTRFEKRLLAASVLGVSGIACLFWPEIDQLSFADDSVKGLALVFGAVILASLGNMGAVRNNSRNLPVIAVNAHGMVWGSIASIIIALLTGHSPGFDWSPAYIYSLIYLAAFGSAIAFCCYIALMKEIGAARAAYSSVLFPIIALLISTFVENYHWSLPAIIGIALILAGNWLALTRKKRT